MGRKKKDIPMNLDVEPEPGDICMHIESGVEYVLHEIKEKTLDGGEKFTYVTFLMEEAATGKLSEPFVVIGGMAELLFIERGPKGEPGKSPVRPLRVDYNPDKTTMTAREGRL